MMYHSIRDTSKLYNFEYALTHERAPDGAFLTPSDIPQFSQTELQALKTASLRQVALAVMKKWIGDDIDQEVLMHIIDDSAIYSIPLVQVGHVKLLELFHGPTQNHKDLPMRIFARILSHYAQKKGVTYRVLAPPSYFVHEATCSAFVGLPGVQVYSIEPRNFSNPFFMHLSTTMGANIKRVVVDGNEHDVKTLINALTTDQELSEKHFVSVRDNTIAALAHTIYTAYLWTLTSDLQNPPSIVVSGGKLKTVTSVLYAKRMGIPVHKIIIATNNDNTPQKYSKYGNFGKDGILSSFNADDRDSSRHNMPLIIHLCNGSVENFNTHFTVIDVPESKIAAMQTFFAHDFNYPMDHRTSLVLAAADSYQKSPNEQVMLFTSGSASRLSDDLLTKQFSHKRPATHVLSSRLDDLKSFLSRDASNS